MIKHLHEHASACSLGKELHLYKNQIGDVGAEKLAAALPSLTNLRDAWLN